MRSFITVIVVGLVLAFLEKLIRKKEKEIEVTEGKFLIKLPSGFFWLGLIEAGIVCIAMVMMKSENDLSIELTIVCILVMLPGVMLMIGPLPGVWDILVDQNNIIVTKCFIFKKHFRFSEITHCIEKRGGWKIYINNQKKKAFFVDRMNAGAGLFMDQVQAANIPIEKLVREE